jgi:hypothetical protein
MYLFSSSKEYNKCHKIKTLVSSKGFIARGRKENEVGVSSEFSFLLLILCFYNNK